MQRKKNKISRREFLTAGTSAAVLARSAISQPVKLSDTNDMLVYVGTYTSGSKSEGIYIYKLNMDNGDLTPYTTTKNVIDPSFLTINKSGRYLYAVNETLEYEGKKSGAVSAFEINQRTGDLKFLNKQPSLGGAPCHVSVSDNEKFVLVANYVGGNVSVLRVGTKGSLDSVTEVKQHSGTGPNKDRQEAAHAHFIHLDRNNRFAVSCDLGADKIYIYKFDKENGKLTANSAQEFYQAKPGTGPRHFVFHPKGRLAFVISELDSSVTSFSYDENRGTLKEIQTISTLPLDWKGENTCAELCISPNGVFLYGSNRGHDSIVSYKIDEGSGKLELIEHVATQGKTPRNFTIDPTGKFLLVANQKSDSVVTFLIDRKSGKLRPTGKSASIPAPVCLRLL
jgi:6-phosphogluconolactonase